MGFKMAFQRLHIVAKRTQSAIEQEVVVECDQADRIVSRSQLHNLVDKLGVVCEASKFKPVFRDLGQEVAEIVANREELALSLWVPAAFVLQSLQFLFEAPTALRLTQTKQDGVQPGISRHNFTEPLLGVPEEFRGQGRTPGSSFIRRGGLSARIWWRKCSGGIIG